MMNYEVTGTPSQVVENVQSIFSVTKAEAELIVMSLLYNQDEEVVDEVAVRNFIGSLDQEKASAVIRGGSFDNSDNGNFARYCEKVCSKVDQVFSNSNCDRQFVVRECEKGYCDSRSFGSCF